jgi:hypothetical protein
MNDMTLPAPVGLADPDYALDDNLTRTAGRVFLTGTQALVRLLCMQKQLDEANGLIRPASSAATAVRRSARWTRNCGAPRRS